MTALAPKRPTEVRRYMLDYARELGGDAIAAYQFVIMSGAIVLQSDEQFGPFAIVAFIGSGVDGQTATLELQMTTQSGQLLIRDFTLLTANALNAAGTLPSSTTKGQLVNKAFGECGLPGYEFDSTATEQADALLGLDILMAELASSGDNLDIGYNFPTGFGGSAMADVSGVPDLAVNFIVGRLAEIIAPSLGKTLSNETRHRMATSLRAIRATFARIPIMGLPRSTPRGAGAKPWSTWWPFVGSMRANYSRLPLEALGTEGGDGIGTEGGEIIGG